MDRDLAAQSELNQDENQNLTQRASTRDPDLLRESDENNINVVGSDARLWTKRWTVRLPAPVR